MKDIAYPRQVIIVTSRATIKEPFTGKEKEKDNLMTLSWHSPVSFEPLLYCIIVSKKSYSYRLIHKSKVFVVNFIPFEMKDKAAAVGSDSGEHQDKFLKYSIDKEEAEKVDCPRLKDALAYFECEVIDEIEQGDHMILVGKIRNRVSKKQMPRLFQSESGFIST